MQHQAQVASFVSAFVRPAVEQDGRGWLSNVAFSTPEHLVQRIRRGDAPSVCGSQQAREKKEWARSWDQ